MILTLALLTSVFILVLIHYHQRFQYWKKKKIPYVEPSIPFGNLEIPFKRTKSFGEFLQDIYNHFRREGHKHGGFYTLTNPVYMPLDPDYIKNILVKDFQYFTNRGIYYDEKNDPLLAFIFGLEGSRWKKMRSTVLPTFTTGKLKFMFPILIESGNLMTEAVDRFAKGDQAIDIKDLLSRFSTDVIVSCAFGLNCNSIIKEESVFRKIGRALCRGTISTNLKYTIGTNFPKLGRLLGFKIVSKDIEEFLTKVVQNSLTYRQEKNYSRCDLLQLLIDLKNKASTNGETGEILTLEETVAVCLAFFVAGFETSSTLLTFTLLELCIHEEIQEVVRTEINNVLEKHDGEITYETLGDMKYLGQVLDESLRLHPPVAFLKRQCNKDYKIPDTDITLDKGTHVLISIQGLHHDEEFYPSPLAFDPERFNEENKRHLHPYTFLPFGEGPRICIGARFAIMESKLALAILLKNYKFTLDRRMKFPLKMDKYNFFFTSVEGDVWLRARRINAA